MQAQEIYWAIYLPTGQPYFYGVSFCPTTKSYPYASIKYGELKRNSATFEARPKRVRAHIYVDNQLSSHLQNALGAEFKVLPQSEVREWVRMWSLMEK